VSAANNTLLENPRVSDANMNTAILDCPFFIISSILQLKFKENRSDVPVSVFLPLVDRKKSLTGKLIIAMIIINGLGARLHYLQSKKQSPEHLGEMELRL
jgi:hypothetical protein